MKKFILNINEFNWWEVLLRRKFKNSMLTWFFLFSLFLRCFPFLEKNSTKTWLFSFGKSLFHSNFSTFLIFNWKFCSKTAHKFSLSNFYPFQLNFFQLQWYMQAARHQISKDFPFSFHTSLWIVLHFPYQFI